MNNRGVYILANDTVMELLIAVLNSFRRYNPTLSLCVIPYDSNTGQLEQLQKEYDFSICHDQKSLEWCDAI